MTATQAEETDEAIEAVLDQIKEGSKENMVPIDQAQAMMVFVKAMAIKMGGFGKPILLEHIEIDLAHTCELEAAEQEGGALTLTLKPTDKTAQLISKWEKQENSTGGFMP